MNSNVTNNIMIFVWAAYYRCRKEKERERKRWKERRSVKCVMARWDLRGKKSMDLYDVISVLIFCQCQLSLYMHITFNVYTYRPRVPRIYIFTLIPSKSVIHNNRFTCLRTRARVTNWRKKWRQKKHRNGKRNNVVWPLDVTCYLYVYVIIINYHFVDALVGFQVAIAVMKAKCQHISRLLLYCLKACIKKGHHVAHDIWLSHRMNR